MTPAEKARQYARAAQTGAGSRQTAPDASEPVQGRKPPQTPGIQAGERAPKHWWTVVYPDGPVVDVFLAEPMTLAEAQAAHYPDRAAVVVNFQQVSGR